MSSSIVSIGTTKKQSNREKKNVSTLDKVSTLSLQDPTKRWLLSLDSKTKGKTPPSLSTDINSEHEKRLNNLHVFSPLKRKEISEFRPNREEREGEDDDDYDDDGEPDAKKIKKSNIDNFLEFIEGDCALCKERVDLDMKFEDYHLLKQEFYQTNDFSKFQINLKEMKEELKKIPLEDRDVKISTFIDSSEAMIITHTIHHIPSFSLRHPKNYALNLIHVLIKAVSNHECDEDEGRDDDLFYKKITTLKSISDQLLKIK